MFVEVNGIRLFFDVDGAGLVPDGSRMREKPTLILLHGGPGSDHSFFKPDFGQLADLAQVVYLDQRGNGRSETGDPSTWTLAQWGDDVKGFCDALGIRRPIVLGLSFGGFVAQSYAVRHPGHPAGLILVSTAARMDFAVVFDAFERFGGPAARAAAEAYWSGPTPDIEVRYAALCQPLHTVHPARDPAAKRRVIQRDETTIRFGGVNKAQGRMDLRADLAAIRCPVLVMAGERDPLTPIAFSEEIARCLPPHLVRFERFPDCGHAVQLDAPERSFALMREFIAEFAYGQTA